VRIFGAVCCGIGGIGKLSLERSRATSYLSSSLDDGGLLGITIEYPLLRW
jgi:hypothetical protein